MRNIILYTALSLDNYIALPNGGIRCIMFSHLPNPHTDTKPSVTFINQNMLDFVQQIKAQ